MLRSCIIICTLIALWWPTILAAASPWVVFSVDSRPYREALEGFQDGFPGSTQSFVLASTPNQDHDLFERLARPECGVIVAMGSRALTTLRERLPQKPVVSVMTLAPSAEILSTPSITGVRLEASPEKTLTLLKQALPDARRIGIMTSQPTSNGFLTQARKAAAALNINLEVIAAPTIAAAIQHVTSLAASSDTLLVIPDHITAAPAVFETLLTISLQKRIPLFGLSALHARDGAIAAPIPDYHEIGLQAAGLAKRILAGTPPASIPWEYARGTGIAINLKSAKHLDLVIPVQTINNAVQVFR